MRPRNVLVVVLAILAFSFTAVGDDVTVSGQVPFASLDGSVLDHDGAANGLFTVSDGDLTILGVVSCNDEGPGNASACAMRFVVSGDMTLTAGAALHAENRRGTGSGGSITLDVGGSLLLRPGSVISSAAESKDAGGDIGLAVAGDLVLDPLSIVSSASSHGRAGTIAFNARGHIAIDGLVAAGPGRILAATSDTGDVLAGGSAKQRGGAIEIRSSATTGTTIRIGSNATIVSQGRNNGSDLVLLEGRAVEIRGLVASLADIGTDTAVTVRSGTTLLIDGRERASIGGAGRGMIRADVMRDATRARVRILARDAIRVSGPAASFHALSANPGANNAGGGTIEVISIDGSVTLSGNAARAGHTADHDRGGRILVAAKDDVSADDAALAANGGVGGAGGAIAIRSYAGGVSWTLGTGDVRPVGSDAGVATALQGTIALTYCTTVSTAGNTFPTNGNAPALFPAVSQSCSPDAPSLPSGEPDLPSGNEPPANVAPVAANDDYTVAEGATLQAPAPGVLSNDVDPDGPSSVAILVSAPVHGSSFALDADGSFTYAHDGSETTSDSFTYKVSDGSAESNVATVTIAIAPVNDAPVAGDDAFATEEGGTLSIVASGVLGNDTDPDDVTLHAVLVSAPTHASSFVFNADGSFTYVHDGSETTSDSFTYKVSDGSAESNVATVTIAIAPVNDAPIANDETYNVDEGGTLAVALPGVLANDFDPDDGALTATLVSGPAHASSFSLNADGSFTYVHDGSDSTTDTFTYRAQDGELESNIATVSMVIAPVNAPPTAFAYSGLPAQAGIRITYPAGKLGGTDPDAGTTITIDTTPVNVVNGMVTINANGSFAFTPFPSAAGGVASFQYRVSDNGTPGPGVSSEYVTVAIQVAGPAIYFTRSVAVGLANCTLGNECTVASALAFIGPAPDARIFIGDAGMQTLPSITLNQGGSIIGQGVQASTFDQVFGIVAPAQGTLAPRPFVGSPRPTLVTTIHLNNNSHARGLNLAPGGDGLVAVGKTGLVVSQLNITSDANDPSTFCVNFTGSSGNFLFGPIGVNAGRNGSGVKFIGPTTSPAITFSSVTMGGSGNAVVIANTGTTGFHFQTVSSNSGRAVDINGTGGQMTFFAINANGASTGILVQNATGSFTVNGTNGSPGTGGTIQNCTLKGADFRGSRNINLRGMTFLNNATVDGPGADCGRIDLSTANNGPLNCNAGISLLSTTSVLISGTSVIGSKQIGIDGQSVNGLALQGVTVADNGDAAGEDGVQLSNVSGNLTINANNTFRDAAANLFEVVNDTGVLTASISASTFRHASFNTAPAADGVTITARGSAVVTPFVGSSTFQNIRGTAVKYEFSGAASGNPSVGGLTHSINFTNNARAIAISAVGTGHISYSIRENTLTNDPLVTATSAMTPVALTFGGAGTRVGTIDNNTIGINAPGSLASGCSTAGCDGIQVTDAALTNTHRLTISNNRVFHVGGAAIRVTSTAGSSETLRARVLNNVANYPDNPASSASAIVIEDANSSPSGVLMTCLDVTGNQVSGLWAGATSHQSAIRIAAMRAQQFALTNFNPATDYAAGAVSAACAACTGPAGDDRNVADFLSQQNPATVAAQNLSGGSSASQERLAGSAPWSGTTGTCP